MTFPKAFDTVPHQRLSIKVKAYGIEGEVLSWIKVFYLEENKLSESICIESDSVNVKNVTN